MTFVRLVPVPTPSWRFWSKPHSDGTIYSNTSASSQPLGTEEQSQQTEKKRGYAIGVRAGRIQYTDLHKGNVASVADVIAYFEWQLISIHLSASDTKHAFQVFMQLNQDTVLEKTEIPKFYDHPEPKHVHLIGSSVDQGQYIDHFRGFLKTVSLYYTAEDLEISRSCSGKCKFCHDVSLK